MNECSAQNHTLLNKLSRKSLAKKQGSSETAENMFISSIKKAHFNSKQCLIYKKSKITTKIPLCKAMCHLVLSSSVQTLILINIYIISQNTSGKHLF